MKLNVCGLDLMYYEVVSKFIVNYSGGQIIGLKVQYFKRDELWFTKEVTF